MFHWNKLPAELRVMINAELYKDCQRQKSKHVLAKCASVCRSWQDTWEYRNFQELVLTPSCLPMLRTVLKGKNSYRFNHIQLIWLRIELEEYDCSVCQTAEDEETIKKYVILTTSLCACCCRTNTLDRHCITFTNAVWSLLKILSAWKMPIGPPLVHEMDEPGLELEISVHSPSDCQHVFRPLPMQDDYPYVAYHESWGLDSRAKRR